LGKALADGVGFLRNPAETHVACSKGALLRPAVNPLLVRFPPASRLELLTPMNGLPALPSISELNAQQRIREQHEMRLVCS
jgi:hypothetical protein